MKYPFSPEILDAMPEEIAELFRALEGKLLDEICSRLVLRDELNQVTLSGIQALRSHGIDIKDIKKAIQETAHISGEKLDALLAGAVERNQAYYTQLIDLAQLTQPEHIVNAADIAALVAQTQDELHNITRSLAFHVDNGRTMLQPAQAYQWALDNAVMQIQSGAISYDQAIRGAVKQLADSGLKTVQYESGHVDQIDVAARRAVLTGVKQLCARYTEASAAYLDTPYYEVSAHSGARDKPGPSPWSSHKDWQGRVYSVREGDIYPSIYSECGLGYVDGLEGANCRHIRNVWVEGISERTYTDEQLANIDRPPFEYDGKTYTMYEAAQMQRRMERTMRKLKREKAAYQAVGAEEDARDTNIRMRRLSVKYTEFSEKAGLRQQRERMNVYAPKTAEAKQPDFNVGVPADVDGSFDEFQALDISKAERAALKTVHKLSNENGYEYGIIINKDGASEAFTNNNPAMVAFNIADVRPGAAIVHSHTNVTPLSAKDFSLLLNENVESIANIAYNGDVFKASVGYGWRPSKEEFDKIVSAIRKETDSDLLNDPSFYEWSIPERNYMAIREQACRIARYFEWELEGGKLE